MANPETILQLARHAEEAGFESIWLADHVAFPVSIKSKYPYSATGGFPAPLSDPLMEPVATMAVLVGATKRVRIGTAALIMPYRNPVLLARMLVTLDHFSGGRIVLGAGVGWLEEEFNVLDTYDFKRRGKVTDEYLEIFKAICAGGEVGYRGETYAFEPIFSSPGSLQRPHPPILIGGLSDAALRRVVRHGNGWLAVTAGPENAGGAPGHAEAPRERSRPAVRGPVARLQAVPEHRRGQAQPLRCARARHRLRSPRSPTTSSACSTSASRRSSCAIAAAAPRS